MKGNVNNYFQLSELQKQLYIHYKLHPKDTSYNLVFAYKIKGNLDVDKFKESVEYLLNSYEVLKVNFLEKDDLPYQYFDGSRVCEMKVIDLSTENIKSPNSYIIDYLDRKSGKIISLKQWPLYEFKLFKFRDNLYYFTINIHHIISDVYSCYSFINDLSNLYNHPKDLKKEKIADADKVYMFFDFINKDGKKEEKPEVMKYFEEELKDVDSLQMDYFHQDRNEDERFLGKTKKFNIDGDLNQKIKSYIKENNLTPFVFFVAVYSIFLHKITRKSKLVMGIPVANRSLESTEIFGYFVNTLPLVVNFEEVENFNQLCDMVKLKLFSLLSYQDFNLSKHIHAILGARRKGDNVGVFNNVITYHKQELSFNLNGCELERVESENKVVSFPLTCTVADRGEMFNISFDYVKSDFDDLNLQKLYWNISKDIINKSNKPISQIRILSQEERDYLLYELNDTQTDYPKDKVIHQLFEEQVERVSDKLAVVHENEKLTYKELNQRANQLARVLKEKEVTVDKKVGIMIEKSLEMIIGTIAILKAGGAYVPIDPIYPGERIEYMIEDSDIDILLSGDKLRTDFEFKGEVINIKDGNLYQGDKSNLSCIAKPDDLAYIMYTSGSTGQPKGVMVEQRNVVRLVKNTNYVDFEKEDKILQTGAISFDASTFEIWGALLNGLELYLVNKEVILDPEKLRKVLTEYQITTLWLTSPLFNQVAQGNEDMFKGVKNLLVGGDVLSPEHIKRVRKECKNIKIINGYGPTENTTFSTTFLIDKDYKVDIPIGKPISNSAAYIVDENNHLQPVGIVGELCVGGDGVARGYLNRPRLTAEKFVDNPFEEGKMYRTGDLARWSIDGNIEFLGRMDYQVKIRGFRVELGAIEAVINSYRACKSSIVTVHDYTQGDKRLVAYIIPEEGEKFNKNELRGYLKERIPGYMMPSFFMVIDEKPLTINGKIDYKALPKPERKQRQVNKEVSFSTGTEKELINIWKIILKTDEIGLEDNFFDVGGNSLLIAEVYNKVLEKFGCKELSMIDLFEYTTVRSLAEYIDDLNTGKNEVLMDKDNRANRRKEALKKRLKRA